ncbi:MAG TPA: glycosyltransferase family 39 protein [Bryobacteraceae bacterium]|nr:glycosyltransferase family 39 protein [Bryobacteraceae bacterium]
MSSGATGGSGAPHWRTPGLLVAVALLAIGTLAGFVRAVLVAPLHVPLDPNEGWNAYHSAAALVRGNPYPPTGSFLTNNYPPLSFYLVGIAGAWVGDNVVAGRLVSLGAYALICVFIVAALRRLNASLTSALFAVLLFASTLLLTSDYVGMDDPQLLGHALQLGALLLLLRQRRRSGVVIASAVLFVAGGFIKHNLFALPLASLAWLVATDRRSAAKFSAALLLLSLAGIVAVQVTLGVNVIHELDSPRGFSVDLLKSNAISWIPVAALPLCSLVWLMFRFGKDMAVQLGSLYAGISIVSGLLLLGGAGVDVNAMFDADIALALCAGLAMSRLTTSNEPLWRAAGEAFAILCVFPLAVIALHTPDWREASFWLHPLREEAAEASRDIAFLRSHPGPAMCENLTFCYWAGKTAAVDVFNLDQQFETGARDKAPFLRRLDAHEFASVELDETEPFPFSNDVEAVFLRNYRIDHRDDDGVFFVPR